MNGQMHAVMVMQARQKLLMFLGLSMIGCGVASATMLMLAIYTMSKFGMGSWKTTYMLGLSLVVFVVMLFVVFLFDRAVRQMYPERMTLRKLEDRSRGQGRV